MPHGVVDQFFSGGGKGPFGAALMATCIALPVFSGRFDEEQSWWYTLTSDVCAKVFPSSPVAHVAESMQAQMLAIHHHHHTRLHKRRKGHL
jgi:hypothetical protein